MIPKGLENLANMEYSGRFIIIGQTEEERNVVIYGITGRSKPSQARTLEFDEKNNVIFTKPTDEKIIAQGSQSLLIYPAMFFLPKILSPSMGGIAVSNGYQTNLINTVMRNSFGQGSAEDTLKLALEQSHFIYDLKEGLIDVTKYEPDKPNFTPRISGCLKRNHGALHLISKKGKSVDSKYWWVNLMPGHGKLISTYQGENKKPLPKFKGDPLCISFESETVEDIAKAVYDSLAPEEGDDDFRVAVAVGIRDYATEETSYKIINRHEVKE